MARRKRKTPSKIVRSAPQEVAETQSCDVPPLVDPPPRPGTPAFGLPAGEADVIDAVDFAYSRAMSVLIARRRAAVDAGAVKQPLRGLVDQVSQAALAENSAPVLSSVQAAIARSKAVRARAEALHAKVQARLNPPALKAITWTAEHAARLADLRAEFVLARMWYLPLMASNNLIDSRTVEALRFLCLIQSSRLQTGQIQVVKNNTKRATVREFTPKEYAATQSPPSSPTDLETHSGSDGDSESESGLELEFMDLENSAGLDSSEIQAILNYFADKQKGLGQEWLDNTSFYRQRLAHFEQVFLPDTDFDAWKKSAPTSGHVAGVPLFGRIVQSQTYFNLVANLTAADFNYLREHQNNFAQLIAGWKHSFEPPKCH